MLSWLRRWIYVVPLSAVRQYVAYVQFDPLQRTKKNLSKQPRKYKQKISALIIKITHFF
jgi:hypothetical protein